jgi:hypothetical protein
VRNHLHQSRAEGAGVEPARVCPGHGLAIRRLTIRPTLLQKNRPCERVGPMSTAAGIRTLNLLVLSQAPLPKLGYDGMEWVPGVEPGLRAWHARVRPLTLHPRESPPPVSHRTIAPYRGAAGTGPTGKQRSGSWARTSAGVIQSHVAEPPRHSGSWSPRPDSNRDLALTRRVLFRMSFEGVLSPPFFSHRYATGA